MNDVLQLKGRFEQESRTPQFGPPSLPSNQSVHVSHLNKLKDDLLELQDFWSKETLLNGALVSVYYNKIAAKSNRIQRLLTVNGSEKANSTIVGARFTDSTPKKHIITHYIKKEAINKTIEKLNIVIDIMNQYFQGVILSDQMNSNGNKKSPIDALFDKTTLKGVGKTEFKQILVDAFYVEKFDVIQDNLDISEESIITIYETDKRTEDLFNEINIPLQNHRIMGESKTTILLLPDQIAILKQKAPYLVSMSVTDISYLNKTDFEFSNNENRNIPSPNNEPTIGVIDTLFDKDVYFSEWVEFENMLDKNIPTEEQDYSHGTAVSSIIVDGATLNPHLDDGCGRFKVRHFGVATNTQFSSFSILRNIESIIQSNKDIKVWNLSLGSKLEINPNFISPEAEILDRIQYNNDVIFIIAGTNKEHSDGEKTIGSPADSINSLVVNSVNRKNNKPATYSRKGPVLSFFIKPDIGYYGGDDGNLIKVHTNNGYALVSGTSFATPWIARKMSYLIDILGLNREIAKSLIVNSATSWDKQEFFPQYIGHGVVPIHIDNIVKSKDDEIQFVLSGVSEKYNTYNYTIPVPISNNKYPFIAKATVCYFPNCSRSQGVDYTNTEVDVAFGRMRQLVDKKTKRVKTVVKTIDNNYQSDEIKHEGIYEEDARKWYRKWDNIKHIREILKPNNRPKDTFDGDTWGIRLTTKERLEKKDGEGLRFGIVITLKEITGLNRIHEFINNCRFRGWIVDRIDVQSRIDIYNIAEEEIKFDDE